MTVYKLNNNDQLFYDLNGIPVDDGYIYIGEENQNPIEYPVDVYFYDNVEAPQPVRTRNGMPIGGNIYCSEIYSLLILNKNREKIYYSASNGEISKINDNLIIDGGFDLSEYSIQSSVGATLYGPDNYNTWIAYCSGKTYTYTRRISYDDIPGWYSIYLDFSFTGNTDLDSDFSKLSHCIEDGFQFSNQYVTLSFWAKSDDIYFDQIATSFTLKVTDSVDTYRVNSINPNIYDLSTDWKYFEKTFRMPYFDPTQYTDIEESCLILNFWTAAGNDYIGETGGLSDIDLSQTWTLSITNIKLEFGQKATIFKREKYQKLHEKLLRRFETSRYETTPIVNVRMPMANSILPGLKFLRQKRNANSTVTIFRTVPGAATGEIEHVGYSSTVILVNTVNDISKTGFGSISTDTTLIDQELYRYQYFVDNDFTL